MSGMTSVLMLQYQCEIATAPS